jgi:transcription antitermination factor NusG
MPILPAEPALFPPDLFTEGKERHDPSREWFVLHVKPRQEKSLAREMYQRAIPFHLPLVKRRTVVRGRVLYSQIPLFPGYLFLLCDREEWLTALNTRRVVRPVKVPSQEELWHDLRQIYRLIASDAAVTPEQHLAPGTPVEILSGPLAGLRGVVTHTVSGRRLWVRVNFIEQGASVLLDDCTLAPVYEARPPAAVNVD